MLYTAMPIVLCGAIFLRLVHLNRMLIFADEIHTIPVTVHKGLLWILTHFTGNDACIPLTAYNHILFILGRLNELGLRLPSALAGSALLVILAWQARHSSTLTEKYAFFLTLSLCGLSPYLVYLSREARPYPMAILFFYLSTCLVFSWIRRDRPAKLYWAALFSFLAIYFHPIVAPGIFVLGLACLHAIWTTQDRQQRTDMLRTCIGPLTMFCLLLACTLGPAWPSFQDGFTDKIVHGRAELQTLLTGLDLLLCIPGPDWLNRILLFALTPAACLVLSKRYPLESCALAVMFVLQLLILYLLQPRFLEIPWVLFRYLVHLIPFWIFALSWLGLWTTSKILPPVLLPACVLLLTLLFAGYHLLLGHYPVNRAYNNHPMALFVSQQDAEALLQLPAARFYRTRLPCLAPDRSLIETPFLATFPLYGLYQQVHHRTIQTTSLGKYFGQELCLGTGGVHWQTAADLKAPAQRQGTRSKPALLIIHKRIKTELKTAFAKLKKMPRAARQLLGMESLFTDQVLQTLFGKQEVSLPAGLRKAILKHGWRICYTDPYLEVWERE